MHANSGVDFVELGPKFIEWQLECNEQLERWSQSLGDHVKFSKNRFIHVRSPSFAAAFVVPESPAADTRWETGHRMVRNQEQHISEERELAHEITWIAALGSRRRFPRFQ